MGPKDKKLKADSKFEEEPSPQTQPVEELMHVELFPGKTGFTTRIGTQMTNVTSKQVIECLRSNVDIFSFSTFDMTRVEPQVALHCLNVNPTTNPVKQKLRQFGPKKYKVI